MNENAPIELKTLYLAQHIGAPLIYLPNNTGAIEGWGVYGNFVSIGYHKYFIKDRALFLRPVESMTDKEADELADVMQIPESNAGMELDRMDLARRAVTHAPGKTFAKSFGFLAGIQWCQINGFAVPFLGYNVTDLQQMEWLVINNRG